MKNTTYVKYSDALIAMELDNPDHSMLKALKDLHTLIKSQNITFVHAIPKYNSSDPLYAAYPHRLLDLHIDEQNKIAGVMENTINDHLGAISAEEVKYLVVQGDPLHVIVSLAEEVSADLIVIGKSQNKHHEIRAKNLIRNTEADVLVVPDGNHNYPKIILVPIDFSDNSLKALEVARHIQKGSHGNIEVYVVNVFQRPSLMAFEVDMTADQFEKQTAINHREGFEKYMNKHFPDWESDMKGILVQTDSPGISKRIMEQADMIIMGAKGHSPLARLLIGSTAEALLDRNDRYSTLVVR